MHEHAVGNSWVTMSSGILEGTVEPGSGVWCFKGIPFAALPVGNLRWRPARDFGPRPIQLPVFGDMNFRSPGMSEDCPYLNVWAPAAPAEERLPMLVFFYGGGNVAGDGSSHATTASVWRSAASSPSPPTTA